MRALCSEPSIELIAETVSFGVARRYPALRSIIKFGLREFCDYALRYAHTNALNL